MTSLFGGSPSLVVDASGTLVSETFLATAGQTVFTLTSFTYTPETNSLLVWINGVKQVTSTDFTETSNSAFTTTSALLDGDHVDVIGFPLATVQVLGSSVADGSVGTLKLANLAVTTLKLADGAVTITKTAGIAASGSNNDITALTQLRSVNASQVSKLRDAIINGEFSVQQYATPYYLSNTPTNQAGYSVDRWYSQINSNGSGTSTCTTARQPFALGQTEVPGEPAYFLRHQVTAVGVVGGPAVIRVEQRIEGVRTFAGQQVTLAFYAKADLSRTFAFVLGQFFGSGGSPSVPAGVGLTFNVTANWQLFNVTLIVPSISEKVIGSDGDFLSACFFLYKSDNVIYNDALGAIGSFVSGQYLDLYIPPSFNKKSLTQEIAECQRYYQVKIYSVVTAALGSTTVSPTVTMRSSPIVTGGGAGFTVDVSDENTCVVRQSAIGLQELKLFAEL